MTYGLIGEQVDHCFEAVLHGLFSVADYTLKSMPLYDLQDFFKRDDFLGVSFAGPYRGVVRQYCTRLDQSALQSGWVTTILRQQDGLVGFDTELTAMIRLLEESPFIFMGKKVLIVGDNGEERTAAACAGHLGAGEVAVVSRKLPGGRVLQKHTDAAYIINTTSVGMYPDNLRAPLSLELFPQCQGIVETVSNPLKSALWLDAEARGLACIGGPALAARHCAVTAGLFTGSAVTEGEIRDAALQLYRQHTNIVLTGPPQAAISEVGRVLARKLGRGYLDVDTILRQTADGMAYSPGLQKNPGLRDLEAEVIRRAGKQTGKVIVVGDNALLADSNHPPLGQNGIIFYLKPSSLNHVEAADCGDGQTYPVGPSKLERYADWVTHKSGSLEEDTDRLIAAFVRLAGQQKKGEIL